MPWAKLAPTKTVIIPYASPPIKPIGQITLKAGKGNTTFQVIDTDQPALLSIEDSKALGVLTLNADFTGKYSTAKPPSPLTPDPGTHKDSAAGPPDTPRYLEAHVARPRYFNQGVHFKELNLTFSSAWLPWPSC